MTFLFIYRTHTKNKKKTRNEYPLKIRWPKVEKINRNCIWALVPFERIPWRYFTLNSNNLNFEYFVSYLFLVFYSFPVNLMDVEKMIDWSLPYGNFKYIWNNSLKVEYIQFNILCYELQFVSFISIERRVTSVYAGIHSKLEYIRFRKLSFQRRKSSNQNSQYIPALVPNCESVCVIAQNRNNLFLFLDSAISKQSWPF